MLLTTLRRFVAQSSYLYASANLLQALQIAPEQVHFKFNVAFVQIQLATTVYNMPEVQRTLTEVQAAAAGLEEAIESLEAIAQHPQTPYPKHDIEQRANMARNTMRRQLERSIQAQREYEEKNAEKLQLAKQKREEELRKREEIRKAAEDAEHERKKKIAEERQKIIERDRELAEARAEEEKQREQAEMTTDSETGDRVSKKSKSKKRGAGGKRRKKNEDGISDDEDRGGSEEEKPKKKRRLQKKAPPEKPSKYKSSEIVVDSDDDDGAAEAAREMQDDVFGGEDAMDVDEEAAPAPVRKNRRVIDSDEEDEAEDEAPAPKEDSPATANGDSE